MILKLVILLFQKLIVFMIKLLIKIKYLYMDILKIVLKLIDLMLLC